MSNELQTEQVTGGLLDGVGVTIGYDSFLRRQSLQTARSANTLSSQSYGYDPASRLQTVTSDSQTATFAYHPNSGLLNTTTFTGGTSIGRSYDSNGRLGTITITPATDSARSYTYTYNNLNQRTRVTREDGSYWSYIYNDRGELVSGKKYWSDNSVVWGAQTGYNFDNIGNRKYARNGGNQLGSLRESIYTAALDVTGTANTAAPVTVNHGAAIRKGEYFYKELAVDNSTGPVYSQINIVGARNNFGAGGEDAVTTSGGRAFVPGVAEAFTYDDDGNNDGLNYTDFLGLWKAEGRWSGGWGKYEGIAQAYLLVYAKSIIDVFTADQFDRLGIPDLRGGFNHVYLKDRNIPGSPGEMLVGDSTYIENYPEYGEITRERSPENIAGPWIGDNVIKVARWSILALYRS